MDKRCDDCKYGKDKQYRPFIPYIMILWCKILHVWVRENYCCKDFTKK